MTKFIVYFIEAFQNLVGNILMFKGICGNLRQKNHSSIAAEIIW